MRHTTHAGIALNALRALISIACCKPKASPSGKRPTSSMCPAVPSKRGKRTKQVSTRVPLWWPFFQSLPGLAFLHRLVLGIHVVCTEVGACGMRLVCLLLQLTGLDRFVAASYGTQHQVNRQVEEAIVAYRHEESAR